MPLRLCRMRFRGVTVPTLIWAIGDVGCPDDLDIPAQRGADVSAFAAALDAGPPRWLVMILSNLAPGAPHAARLCDALVERGYTARRRPLWSCPELTLPASWDAYLATLSANRRQLLRRKERALRRQHAIAVTDYAEDRLDEGWRYLLALHERRWNGAGGGAFHDARAARVQRRFAGEMARQQRLWLTTLDVDGAPAAAWYGFESASTVYFYQGGRDPRWAQESVGLVLMSLMIQRAIQRGFRAFNFLRGDDPYKQQWTTASRMTEELVVFRPGWRGRCLRALDALGDVRGRLVHG
jgi:CelD/BcsL family acetyltransferase involved in cellulose biosynthesis